MGGIGKVFQGLNLPATISSILTGVGGGPSPAAQRTAFVQLLTAYARHAAAKTGPFNLELEINDLWVRLTNLKAANAGGQAGALQMQQQMGQLTQVMGLMSTMVKDLDGTLMNSIRNMK